MRCSVRWHSVKGRRRRVRAGAAGSLRPCFETTLDHLRARELEQTPHVLKVMLRAADLLADLVRAAQSGAHVDEARCQRWRTNWSLCPATTQTNPRPWRLRARMMISWATTFDFKPLQVAFADSGSDEGEGLVAPTTDVPGLIDWVIKFRPLATLYLKANDPALVLRELERLGALEVMLEQADLRCWTIWIPRALIWPGR